MSAYPKYPPGPVTGERPAPRHYLIEDGFYDPDEPPEPRRHITVPLVLFAFLALGIAVAVWLTR